MVFASLATEWVKDRKANVLIIYLDYVLKSRHKPNTINFSLPQLMSHRTYSNHVKQSILRVHGYQSITYKYGGLITVPFFFLGSWATLQTWMRRQLMMHSSALLKSGVMLHLLNSRASWPARLISWSTLGEMVLKIPLVWFLFFLGSLDTIIRKTQESLTRKVLSHFDGKTFLKDFIFICNI